ncbi:hypothetical protein SLS60_000136 [Paraconiothyrium brasiliense]|uniref:NACHT domain-containing protein n=1 Tax=Paraconiothyrium brasiliense TaxID=300254 RepID=A0ABR3S5F1_9PLEO
MPRDPKTEKKSEKGKAPERTPGGPEQEPQRVSQNPATPHIIKNAPRGAFDARRFVSPLNTILRQQLALTSKEALSEVIDNAKRKSEHCSGRWANPGKRLKREPTMDDDEWQQAVGSEYDDWHRDHLSSYEAQIGAHSFLIQEYQKNEREGYLPSNAAKSHIQKAEETISDLNRETVILRAYKHSLRGEYLDTYLKDMATDMAYVDLLISRYSAPDGSRYWFKDQHGRDTKAQERFRTDVITRYDSKINRDSFWCPISRNNLRSSEVTAAHLVPYNTGEGNCDYLFGSAETAHGHLMSPSNGLILSSAFEKTLDDGAIIIVPAARGDVDPETKKEVDFDNDKEPYKVRVLDQSLVEGSKFVGIVQNSMLDGRILEFRNNNRPKKRYLWYLAIINLARRRRCQVTGWQKDSERLGSAMWASPGEWLRRSTIHSIMRQIGFDTNPEDTLKLGPVLKGGIEESPTCKEIVDRVAVNLSPPSKARRANKGGEDVDGSVWSRVYSNTLPQTEAPIDFSDCTYRQVTMDPLTAVGFASNIVQFVSFARDLISKGKEIARSADGALIGNLEIEFITKSIYDLNSYMGALPEEAYNKSRYGPKLSKADEQLQMLSLNSKEVARELLATLQKLKIPDGKKKPWSSLGQALRSVLSAERIEELSSRLDRYQTQINSALLISLTDMTRDEQYRQKLISSTKTRVNDYTKVWLYELSQSVLKNRWDPRNQQDLHRFAVQLEDSVTSDREALYRFKIHHYLRFDEIEERQETIADAHRKTFDWIFKGNSLPVEPGPESPPDSSVVQWSDFPAWIRGEKDLYWISGKPGSGKSTLMKYLYRHSTTDDLAKGWASSSVLIKAGFFLWNSGSAMQMSLLGLLQGLLYESVKGKLDLLQELFPTRWQNYIFYGADLRPWTWIEIRAAFRALLNMSKFRFLMFIDGLDEFDKNPSELMVFLQEIRSLAPQRLKLCVASRPWLIFEDAFRLEPWLRLQDLTRNDIRMYTEENLAAEPRWTELSAFHPEAASKLVLGITSKASGVILWVVLVVESLRQGLRDGDFVADLFVRLDKLPSSLEDLFRKILDQLDPEYLTQACELFGLVHCAVEPLSLLTISLALEGYEASIEAQVSPIDIEELQFRAGTVRRRIMSRCKGLLEVKDYRRYRHVAKAQYMHRTVRDFFQSEDVKQFVQSGAPDCDVIRNLCGSYLRQVKGTARHRSLATIFDYTISTIYDDFWFAFDDCVTYAKAWEIEKSTVPFGLLDELERTGNAYWGHSSPHWVNTYHRVTSPKLKANGEHHSLSYDSYLDYMLQTDCTSYVLAKAREKSRGAEGRDAINLLMRSLELRKFDFVQALIDYGIDTDACLDNGTTAWLEILRRARGDGGKEGSETLANLIEYFLDHGADPSISVRPVEMPESSRPVALRELLPQILPGLSEQRMGILLAKLPVASKNQKRPPTLMKRMKSMLEGRRPSERTSR